MKFASLSGVLCLMMLVAFPLKAEIGLPFPGNWQLPPGTAVSAGVLTVASTDREARLARTEIDSRDYIGRTLIVHFDVKYTDVSTPALSHNGIKLMIHTRVNGKQFWRNCPPHSGSSDGWKRITVRENISWDTEWISIEVGLQDSTGILEVRNVEIQDYDPMVLFREPPVPLPENFKCAYDERLRNLPPMRGVMSPVRYRVNDIPDLAKWNANLIRWQLRPSPQKIYIPGVDQQKAERNRTTENFLDALDRELQTLDKVISQCREAGIMVMIDMHRVPGGSENLGEIQSEARMFNSEELAAEFIEAWRRIARRYRGNPVIYGYDLINEPNQRRPCKIDYLTLQYQAAQAIREIDPDTPICIAASNWNGPRAFAFLHPLPLKNLIYNVHMYHPLRYTHQGVGGTWIRKTWPGVFYGKKWDKEVMRGYLAPVREFQRKYGARIVMSEFGVIRWAPNGADYLRDLLEIAEEYGWDWCYHAYREWSGWSAEHSDDRGSETPDLNNPRLKVLLEHFRKNTRPGGGAPPPEVAAFAAEVEPEKSEAPLPVIDLNSPEFSGKLTAAFQVKELDGIPVLTVANSDKAADVIFLPLDEKRLAGKEIILSADIRQHNVSPRPRPYNGVKLMLVLTGADGKRNYPQASTVDGTCDWTRRTLSLNIPADVRKAELALGLENVCGIAEFRNIRIEKALPAGDYSRTVVTGRCGRDDALYAPGETMKFCFDILDGGKKVSGRLRVLFSGDDGSREEKEFDVPDDKPLEVTASLDAPGYMMVRAALLTPQGAVINRRDDRGVMRPLQYGLAAAVEPDKLRQGKPEPADFDEFWRKCRRELDRVPVKVLERKLFNTTEHCHIYDVKIAAPGPRPTVGYLAIPREAAAKSLPIDIRFDGYAVHAIRPVERRDAIVFFVNAHGIENNREPEYYRQLADKELYAYGFREEENEDPDTCYFKYMILRDLRAVAYAMSLPEWNGGEILVSGGSQGAFRAAAVAALTPQATRCELQIPWFCDLGGAGLGRTRGWRPVWKRGLGYYDTVNFARRIQCPVEISAGLSDWICPPSGVQILYNNLTVPKRMVMYQGWDHAPYFGYDRSKAQKSTFSTR